LLPTIGCYFTKASNTVMWLSRVERSLGSYA
jgi:hypothetical protein